MSALTWGRVGTRRFESGVDRGVLYPPVGDGVAWSGLTSIVEKMRADVEGVYFDGMRIGNAITYGEFSADLSCITYPPEFDTLQGVGELRRGVMLGDQPLQTFGLCYRTMIGDDTKEEVGYKLHIVYNLIAVPSEKTYTSQSDDPAIVEYGYALTAIPEEVSGFRPTAQIVIKSTDVYPWLLEELEAILYGSAESNPRLPPMRELIAWVKNWARVKITVNEAEGTWTASSDWPEYVFPLDDGSFILENVNAYFLDEAETSYTIDDTVEDPDLVEFEVIDNGDGTWSARTNQLNVIVDHDDGTFEIRDADPIFTGDTFRIQSKRLA